MTQKNIFRRLFVAFFSLLLTLSACSPPKESSSEDNFGAVEVSTKDGPLTLTGTPKRIVTLGNQWIDVVLAFGLTPVAQFDNIEALTQKHAPWVGEKLNAVPKINTGEIVASVAKAQPDLILSMDFGAAQKDTITQLKKLAPTVLGITKKQIDPWQDLVTFMGTVLRQPNKAKQIIADTNEKISSAKQKLSAGKNTYSLAWMFTTEQIQVLADPEDGANELFTALGFSIAPQLIATFQKNSQPRFPISVEQVPLLNADLLIITASSPAAMKTLKSLPGYRKLSAVRKKAVCELSIAEISGINQPTSLAIDYLLSKLLPYLQKASR